MNYGRKVMDWLASAAGQSFGASWQMDGIRRSLRLTLSWLSDGRTLYEIPSEQYVCIMTAHGRTEVRQGTRSLGTLPLRSQLDRAGIRMSPGEGFLLDPVLVSALLEEQLRVQEALDPIRGAEARPAGFRIPPGAGVPA